MMSGSCTAPTTGPRPTTWPRSTPRSWPSCSGCSCIEASKYNVFPLDDRRVRRFNPDLAGRPQLIRGDRAAAVRRHGPAHRELGGGHQEQVPLDHRPGRGPRRRRRGRAGRPGWRLRWLEPVRHDGGRPAYCYNLFGLQRFNVYGDQPIPAGAHQSGPSSPTTAAGWPRAAPSPSTSTAPRPVKAASTPPSRWPSPADETTDVGGDTATPVSDDYGPKTAPSAAGSAGSRSTCRRRRPRPPHHPRRTPPDRHGQAVSATCRLDQQCDGARRGLSSMPASRSVASALVRFVVRSSLRTQGRPCGWPRAAAVLAPATTDGNREPAPPSHQVGASDRLPNSAPLQIILEG